MTEHITATGWTLRIRPNDGKPTFRVIARSPDGQRAIHLDKATAEEIERFNPDADFAFAAAKMRARS